MKRIRELIIKSRYLFVGALEYDSFVFLESLASLPRSRFLDVTQRFPKVSSKLRDIQKTAKKRETNP